MNHYVRERREDDLGQIWMERRQVFQNTIPWKLIWGKRPRSFPWLSLVLVPKNAPDGRIRRNERRDRKLIVGEYEVERTEVNKIFSVEDTK